MSGLGSFLAWGNFRAKRGGVRGANRAAAFVFAVEWLGLLLNAHHVAAADEVHVLFFSMFNAALPAAGVWVLYLALESYVRRCWPQSMMLLSAAYSSNANLLFLKTRGLANGLLLELINKFLAGLALTFLLMLLRVLLRREWLTATALILLYALGGFGLGGFGARSGIVGTNAILFAALFAATLLRFGGLLPTIVCFFVGNDLTDPLVADFSTWYASTTVFVLVISSP